MMMSLFKNKQPFAECGTRSSAKMLKRKVLYSFLLLFLVSQTLKAQFVHPGGVHSQADLDRMKTKILANAHPWIDGWNLMLADSKAQKTYVARPSSSVSGANGVRQQAARDAAAAYYNTLRWYVTGDTSYANCAVRILNAWSGSINQVVTGELFQLPVTGMVQAGELLRIYPGWAAADFNRFKNMCLNYFYPACHSFIGECGSWPGWDGPANAAILYIGILCDDQAKFDEAINYYKTGTGGGNITNAIWQPSGQITEMGRDQPHAEIGPTFMAEMCQTAWNQGVDLFSYANNRLLAGFEYFCKFNLNNPVDWVPYNGCANRYFFYPAMRSENRISVSPAYELIYNHYVIRKGLSAPYTRAMINLHGLTGTTGEYVGYCGFTYTLSDTSTVFQPKPIPATPTNLTATAGVANVSLKWTGQSGNYANGYNVLRATGSGGPYTTIASWKDNTSTYYTDTSVIKGTTYFYKVSANNQSGTSALSTAASAKPVAADPMLLSGWTKKDIGNVGTPGTAAYADVRNKTFVVGGLGGGSGGTADAHNFVYTSVTGDFTLTARVYDVVQDPSNLKVQVGLMMRESLDANAKKLAINIGDTQTRYTWFSVRSTTGGNTSWPFQGDTHTWVPVWFKLQRSGTTFTASQSSDGVTWFTLGSITVSMSNTYFAGMFVGGGASTPGLTTATFDNVTTVGGGGVPSSPGSLTGTSLSSSRNRLQWTAAAAASGYNVKRSLTSAGPYTTIATGVADTSYIDSGLVASTNYYYVVKAANIAGESVDSVQTTVKTQDLKLPSAPTGLKASVGNAVVTLNWNATDEATSSYKVRRATTANGTYNLIGSPNTTSYSDSSVVIGSTYFYTVSAVNIIGEGAASAPDSVFLGKKLTGTLIGTTGSYNNNPATTKAAAMDGNFNTFFDAVPGNGAWVGIDVGAGNIAQVTQVGFAPRWGYPQRMTGGLFQGANNADFSDAITLSTVSVQPTPGILTLQTVANSGNYRYLRYLSPNNGFCNVAEIEFRGLIKRTQTITFNAIAKKRAGDSDFDPGATASSGLPVKYSSSDTTVAVILNGKLHIKAAGTSVITALQAGDTTYNTAIPVSQVFSVAPLNLQVQYQDGDNGQLTNNIVRPFVKIVNADSIGVAYNELTMRYWFTAENYRGINTWIDYAQLGNNNVQLKYVQLPQPHNGAFGYIEYSFTSAGNLAANTNTGPIESRFANVDWGNLNEGDDYSYQSNTNNYTANNHISLYRNGTLIWGEEPVAQTAVTGLNVAFQNQNQDSTGNTISSYLAINNTGNTPVALGDISARYWFTGDAAQSLNYWIDYAKMGTANISGAFVKVDPALNKADTYFGIAINPSAGMLYPLSTSGNIQYRIAKADWSNFNELNDYSYLPKGAMGENNHITVYYRGQLIYGVEPSPATLASSNASKTTLKAAVVPEPVDMQNGIVVHQGLSPNGDGINDVLVIEGLSAYPNNKLTIMTANGTKIFEVKGYDNSSKVFDGHSNINGTMQRAGTYFYSLEYQSDGKNKIKTGFIILKY